MGELIEPVQIHQFWNVQGYDRAKRKAKMVPKVSCRESLSHKMKPVPRETWFQYIKNGWLPVSDQLRGWLDENGFDHIKKSYR